MLSPVKVLRTEDEVLKLAHRIRSHVGSLH
jgi:hypothetical protein